MSTKIVVIDAEPLVRSVVTSILEREGYEVESAADFESGLDLVRTVRPALVLTNVVLPGITGHDAMHQLKEEFPYLQVLMVSGLPDHSAIRDWIKETRFDTFPKPFKASELVAKVRGVLDGSEQVVRTVSR